MSALQISKFNQLMANKSRTAIRNYQVAFALLDRDSWRERFCPCSRGVDNRSCGKKRPICQANFSATNFYNRSPQIQFRSVALRALDQKPRCTRWIEHRVFRNQQSARHSLAQVRLETFQ